MTTATRNPLRSAFLEFFRTMILLGLGALLGILLLFRTGLYPGHLHYTEVVKQDLRVTKDLYEHVLTTQMVSQINRNLFPNTTITSWKTQWKDYEPSLIAQWYTAKSTLKAASSSPGKPELPIDRIMQTLGELQSTSRFPKFEIISVSKTGEQQLDISYRWFYEPNDLYSPGTGGALMDVMVWLGMFQHSTDQASSQSSTTNGREKDLSTE